MSRRLLINSSDVFIIKGFTVEKVLFQHGIIEVWLFLHKFSKRALSIYLPLVTNDNAVADVFTVY